MSDKRQMPPQTGDGLTKRETIWAIIPPKGASAPRHAEEREARKPLEKSRKSRSFYIHLTNWKGLRFALKCRTGQEVPMEKSAFGGTYLFYGNRMLYVLETRAEINALIRARLSQLQQSWQA